MFSRMALAISCTCFVPAELLAQPERPTTLIVIDAPREMSALGPPLREAVARLGWTVAVAEAPALGSQLGACMDIADEPSRNECSAGWLRGLAEDYALLSSVHVSLDMARQVRVTFRATLLDRVTGEVQATRSLECYRCDDLDERSVHRAVALATQVIRGKEKNLAPNTRLVIETVPSDARIFLDDDPLGTTAAAGPFSVPPGPLQVRIEHPGYRTWVREVDIPADRTRQITVVLEHLPMHGTADTRPSVSFWRARGPKLVTGLGALFLGHGVWWLAVDEDPAPVGKVRKKTYHDTATRGVWATAIGGLVGAAGLYWWWRSGRGAPGASPPVTITPTGTGATLDWSGSF